MRLVKVGRVVLESYGKVLFDRRRPRQRGRVEPGRHRDDHRRADRHDAQQRGPRGAVAQFGKEADQVGPESVYRDRDGSRIDERGEEDEARGSVQQAADAEIGVDAGGEREGSQHESRHRLQGRDVPLQFACGQGVAHVAVILGGRRMKPALNVP
jgi:hypothetical protein